jgi:hypothetical protein
MVRQLQNIRLRIDGNKSHARPHLHVDYGRKYHTATYAIDSGARLAGNLDVKYDGRIQEWIRKHKYKLELAWTTIQTGRDAAQIVEELRVAA